MTIESDWGDWLPTAIADASPNGVRIWYLGCNGVVLKGSGGTTLFIDPYLGTGDPPRTIRMLPIPFDPDDVLDADAVFATHEHVDHAHGPSQAPILANTAATFYGPDESVAVTESEGWTADYDVDDTQIETVREGDRIDLGEFTVTVHPANDPDAAHPVTYVVDHEAGTFFHGGDSKPTPAFESIARSQNIDLGVLAFGTVGMMPDRETHEPTRTKWYNDETQLIEAANALELDRVLPSHWDMWKRLTADPTALHYHVRSFEYPRSITLVEIGDSVALNDGRADVHSPIDDPRGASETR
ncbi:MAG: MBL fold metallo-hydrolase [Halobacteriota archaeon]|uniref:MBL fold metallo-hydrolase n=1 Tax=Natronomonas sp. TaxID=2184060 RepID=UPI0039752C95